MKRPTIKDQLAAKLKHAFKNNFSPQQFLKFLCPFELTLDLKIFANRNGHDFAILFKSTQQPFIDDPRDLQALITQFQESRAIESKRSFKFKVQKIKYDKKTYNCIWIDFIKTDPEKTQETPDPQL